MSSALCPHHRWLVHLESPSGARFDRVMLPRPWSAVGIVEYLLGYSARLHDHSTIHLRRGNTPRMEGCKSSDNENSALPICVSSTCSAGSSSTVPGWLGSSEAARWVGTRRSSGGTTDEGVRCRLREWEMNIDIKTTVHITPAHPFTDYCARARRLDVAWLT